GNYLILAGAYTPLEIRDLMIEAYTFVANYEGEVPGTTPETCGNYLMHDLPMAKWEAQRYIQRLQNDFHSEYARYERPQQDGMVFHDA
ncbi:MAG: S-ribosylhomocysteine lyase, partial [Bacteroidales bacterium]|nr:S-ribosylhomocysteine lyase [Bacteroidales bacterium]